ncbi:hypothetical protein [Frondihabitans australicus]|uniref:Bacterial Ig domain-containing protein n=1 Tax=Frondihabitans australicus TaxID=386892 RepID=A0A495IIB2_9MICO|nr:hypothetical protein [Frondihabitans australicus]RKR75772.1 hypothetical protein C8E83_2927 [Frondihabitans australicus]
MNKKFAAALVCGAVALGTLGTAVGANAATTDAVTAPVSAAASTKAAGQLAITSSSTFKPGTTKTLEGTGPANQVLYVELYDASGAVLGSTYTTIDSFGHWSIGVTPSSATASVLVYASGAPAPVTAPLTAGSDSALGATVTSDAAFTPGAVKTFTGTGQAGRVVLGDVVDASGMSVASIYATADASGVRKASVVLPAGAKTFMFVSDDDRSVVHTRDLQAK